MKKALMLRPGQALGDGCWVTPIPRLLTEKGYDVDVAIDPFIRSVFDNNPYVKGCVDLPAPHLWHEWEDTCMDIIKQYDHVCHVHGFVETGLLHRSDVKWGSIPNACQRKEAAKGVNYQDLIFQNTEMGNKSSLPEFYFTDTEKKDAKRLRRMLNKDKKKLILWQMDGSSRSKTLVWMPTYLKHTLDKYPDAVHYVYTWDPNLDAQVPNNDSRIFRANGKISVRESIVLTSIADLVIGPESFLINAAAAFKTPKIVFFSHSAPENLTKYFKNCTNIIPNKEVTCHPCYIIQAHFQRIFDPVQRGIAREFERNCIVWNRDYCYESLGYKCCYFLPHDEVYAAIEKWIGGKHA